MTTTWVKVEFKAIPQGVRFDVRRQDQGQIVEVAYGFGGNSGPDARTARYKRVTDRSVGPVPTYYRRA